MSDHPTHPGSASDLDANVDALADQLGIQAEADGAAAHDAAVATLDAPPIPNPPAQSDHADHALSPDALLSEISDEIERNAPGQLPTPPEPPPVAYIPPPAPFPTEADIAAAAADVDADLDTFEAPSKAEIAPAFEPAPLPAPVPTSAHVVAPPAPLRAAAPSAANSTDRPGPEIQKLDAALAAGAERALAAAKHDEPREDAKTAVPESEFEPELPAESLEPIVVAPAPVASPAPAAPKVAPAPATTTVILHDAPAPPAPPAPAPAPSRVRVAITSALTLPLRPLVALHETLAEPTRQTIAYCALITIFFAACVWGRVVFFPAKNNLEPTGHAAEFYDDTTPAHGTHAPAKHGAAAAGGHGEAAPAGESAGHGEAKKPDAHAKPEKKSSGGHGAEAKPKPEKKSSSHAKKASAPPAGGH